MRRFPEWGWLLLIGIIITGALLCADAFAEVAQMDHRARCALANGSERTLDIHIWYPEDASGGPYPLVVFSHGLAFGTPTQCKFFTEGLAEHDYITCATAHSTSMQKGMSAAATPPPGYLDVPLEMKAEIDELLRLNSDPDSELYGMVDENAIGVTGHSCGGWAAEVVCGTADDEIYIDQRVKAGCFYAPANSPYNMLGDILPVRDAGANIHTATMFFFGTMDEMVRMSTNKFVYDNAPAPKYCALISGMDHFIPAVSSSGVGPEVMEEYAAAFFDRYLKHDTSADAILQTEHRSFASYEYELGEGDDGTASGSQGNGNVWQEIPAYGEELDDIGDWNGNVWQEIPAYGEELEEIAEWQETPAYSAEEPVGIWEETPAEGSDDADAVGVWEAPPAYSAEDPVDIWEEAPAYDGSDDVDSVGVWEEIPAYSAPGASQNTNTGTAGTDGSLGSLGGLLGGGGLSLSNLLGGSNSGSSLGSLLGGGSSGSGMFSGLLGGGTGNSGSGLSSLLAGSNSGNGAASLSSLLGGSNSGSSGMIGTNSSGGVDYTTFRADCTLANGDKKTLTIYSWCPQNKQGGPYPLVIFSHAFLMGYAAQSKYITAGLSRQGYVVCATTYEDSIYYHGQRNYIPGYWDRPLEARAIIDAMLRLNDSPSSSFYGLIDENAIGVCGHSLGGWTSEALCGAVPAEQQMCMDNRVGAGVFYAPANVMTRKELSNAPGIRVPTMTFFGALDTAVPAPLNDFVYEDAATPKYCAVVKGMGHFDFADMGAMKPGAKAVVEYTTAFFNRYLKGDISAEKTLQTKHSSFSSYEYEVK